MTKREALDFAVRAIEAQPQTVMSEKAVQKLKQIEEEVCRKSWTRDSCVKALADWKETTGRAPIVSNLGADDLPSKFVIERVFGERASVVLKRLFPDGYSRSYCEREYCTYTREQIIKFLGEQMQIVKPMTGADYNIRRLVGSPRWETFARRIGCHSWVELYSTVTGTEDVTSRQVYNQECKILEVEVKSPLADKLNDILAESKGE